MVLLLLFIAKYDAQVVSTAKFEKNIEMTDLASLTDEALDGFGKLKFTMAGNTFMYTITGYTIHDVSNSQRTVKFYCARGDIVKVAVAGTQVCQHRYCTICSGNALASNRTSSNERDPHLSATLFLLFMMC